MAPKIGKKAIQGIEGGEAPTRINMDQNLTADHIYQTYRRYPSYKEMLKLEVDAIWSNYLSEDIPLDRILECKDCMEDGLGYGYSAIIVDNTLDGVARVDRWHPIIEGVGFSITEVSPMGNPLEITINASFSDTSIASSKGVTVQHYPCKIEKIEIGKDEGGTPIYSEELIRDQPIAGERGFFLIRTRGGKKGIRGLPYYLSLIMPIRKAYDILENYAIYAENQALAQLLIKLKQNTKPARGRIKREWTQQPTHRKVTIIGADDTATWESPMKSAWNPFEMLGYIDKLIMRSTQLNKLMMEGSGAGELSASETSINNWIARIKEKQAFWLAQFKPIFILLGTSEDIQFSDPAKPTFTNLMNGIKSARDALYGIIEDEDLVKLFNEYLLKHGNKNKLRVKKVEEPEPLIPGQDIVEDDEDIPPKEPDEVVKEDAE